MTATQGAKEKTVSEPGIDPRLKAFLAPDGPEVFHSVATPTAMWRPDPFDIETIHLRSREAFARLLTRAGRTPAAPSGSVLVLLGDAGSGKTHLMRAFRNLTHTSGNGYCGYMQMTTETSSYSRYMLHNLISDLEKPYTPEGSRTGLNRLSASLLEKVPDLAPEDVEKFREGDGDATALADDYADRLQSRAEFQTCDLELIRVLIHLERNDNRVRSRALMWLRCLDMRGADRRWIGDAVPRIDDADPDRMIRSLASVMRAAGGSPLVLLIDQLEDMSKQDRPVERFRKVVDAITALADQNSNVVVVMACLEDYFRFHENEIGTAKKQRLMNDPPPITMHANCTLDEIRAMASNRLQHLLDEANVESDPNDPLFPFAESDIAGLAGRTPREVLLNFLRHHQACISQGRWITPWAGSTVVRPLVDDLSAVWNDFETAFTFPPEDLDEEHEFAQALASAVRHIAPELPDGNSYGQPQADDRFLELELTQPDGSVAKTLVAVCNRNAKGGGLNKQLDEVEERAGEIPASIVRTTGFPKTGQAMVRIGKMIKNSGQTVVVPDSDWRRMLAFAAFREKHSHRPDFAAWQKEAQPLGELASLQKLLRLNSLKSSPRQVAPVISEPIPHPIKPMPAVSMPKAKTVEPPKSELSTLTVGNTVSITPTPVNFEPLEFTRHAAFLGGSGSGKTTAALNLIEQLLAQDVPAVLIDRKGDLSRYADPSAWGRPLQHPNREAARAKLKAKLDIAVYTPGDASGRALALPVVPPGFEQLPQADRERFALYAATGIGSMMNFKTSHPDQVQRVILAKAIETLAAVPGSTIDLPHLRALIAEQDPLLMATLGDSYQPKYFATLAERLQTLQHTSHHLFQGAEQLDLEALLGVNAFYKPGRVRLTVINTRFLGSDLATDFWVSQFLISVARYCAKHPKPHLQAVFLFDEADKYLPATKKPATKEPMEDLLKRARSAGVGIFLGTQSPGDLDYKCKENLQTWFIGKVQQPTAIEKLKPLLAANPGACEKLGTQPTGQFYLVREGGVLPMRSFESFLKTEQQSETEILELARGM